MVNIKTKQELEIMRKGGAILAEVLFEVLESVAPGISELELDRKTEELIKKRGAEPGFKKVPGYHHTICVSVNEVVVHGIPTDYRFKEGDIVGIDCGVYYQGFHTDMAETVIVARGPATPFPPASARSSLASSNDLRAVGSPSSRVTPHPHADRFLSTGKRALGEAIKQARVGNRVGHISKVIQEMVEKAGYSVVRSLVGHGVGRQLHEEPEVPGFLTGPVYQTVELREGMTMAIEVIYNKGRSEVILSDDGWTIKTKDDSLSGLFERTVAVTVDGPIVLTA